MECTLKKKQSQLDQLALNIEEGRKGIEERTKMFNHW